MFHGTPPQSDFLKAADGNLYAICRGGANSYAPMIFQYNPTTSTFTKTVDFASTDGYVSYNSLIEIPVTIATLTLATTYCVGNTVNVPYTVEGAYNSNNVFTAQLSNTSGVFTTPTTIGTYSSNLAGIITATMPAVAQSALYRVRVVSSSQPVVGTDNGTNITVNTNPTITATTNNTLLCTGETVTLSVTGATSYTWSTTQTTSNIVISPTVQTTYTVNGVNANGCLNSNTITQDVSLCTGIWSLSGVGTQIEIYPNPNNGLFTISLNTTSQVTVTNVLGQIVLTETMESGKHDVDIQNQCAGVYFVKAIQNGKQYIVKLIKE